jgi:hypothetical protein
MILHGAVFNWNQYKHKDLILNHKIFIDELLSNPKYTRNNNIFKIKSTMKSEDSIENFNKSKMSLKNRSMLNEISKNANIDSKISMSFNPYDKDEKHLIDQSENIMIANNISSDTFIKILQNGDLFLMEDPNTVLVRSSRILENIKEKIIVDAVERPLKIFWIKADWGIVARIIAWGLTGLAMIFSCLIKKIDFYDYLLPN